MSPVLIKKVVSGGQTGVDRAALDVAQKLGIACGGWCPKGRLAEDGPIPAKYPLKETPSCDYPERTEWNVRDCDGTLVLSWGRPSGGTALTIALARRLKKPCLVIDLETAGLSCEKIAAWIDLYGIATLNVAGPRESPGLPIYRKAHALLIALLR